VLKKIARQFRKPEGILGRLIAMFMERNNKPGYDWMLAMLKVEAGDKVLEVGYGTGALLEILASTFKDAMFYGVDFSELMFKKATKRNKKYIEAKQVILSHGDFLDYAGAGEFSKIYGMNVLYFWADLLPYFVKLHGLLKKNGVLYLIMASPERLNKMAFTHQDVFNKYTVNEVVTALKKSAFNKVHYETRTTPLGEAYCLIAEK
jgi:cyclopropane fatty-acyl-phospholipid synthase-like methyltransferase